MEGVDGDSVGGCGWRFGLRMMGRIEIQRPHLRLIANPQEFTPQEFIQLIDSFKQKISQPISYRQAY